MNWLRNYFDPSTETLAPEDILAHKVRNVLAADEKLLAIFGPEKIETVPFLNGSDLRDFPRLQIAAYNVSEVSGVTNNDSADIRIYIRIRYDAAEWAPLYSGETEKLSWPYGVASMATLVRHIVRLLKAEGVFEETFPSGTASLANQVDFGPYQFSIDQPDPTAGRFAFNHDIQVTYKVNLIYSGTNAGKIHNAAANGG
jgi:hypothetical protein